MKKSIKVLARLMSAAATLVGVLVLGMWVFDDWRAASFGPAYVPTAPITAGLFALLGLGQMTRQRWRENRAVVWFETVGALVAIAVAILAAAQAWRYIPLPWDTWFEVAGVRVGTIPIGRMAPLTAAAFVLTAAAILANNRSRPLARWTATVAGTGSLLIGTIVTVGYVTGTPFHYSADIVPMAWLTALAFVLLNTGILLSGPAVEIVRRWSTGNHVLQTGESDTTFARRLAIIAVLVGGLVVALGLISIRSEQSSARETVNRELDAVANLKATQISQWREERLAEGRFLQRAPTVAADIAAFLSRPGDPAAVERVRGWLEPIKAGRRYDSVLIYDANGRLRLTIADDASTTSKAPEQLPVAPTGSEVSLGDFEAHPDGSAVHLHLFAPIFPAGVSGAEMRPPVARIATVLLRLNPNAYLYPMLQRWPLPSETAEALLVRREGNEVVYLNQLKYQPGAALTLRRSIDEPILPAALGLRGKTDVRKGEDYRGVPVLAATRPISGTPWLLVAKIDLTEVYAPIRRGAVRSGILIASLLLTVGLSAAFSWRQRHAIHLQRILAAERERAKLAERLSLVMRHANDSILVMDNGGSVLEANERALVTYGYSLDELRQLPPGGLRAPVAVETHSKQFDLFNMPDGTVFETVHRRKDGTTFPVEISGATFELDGSTFKLGVLRNLSQRRTHERQLERLNRLYAALSEVNQAIVHAKDRGELLQNICRVLVEFGRFRMAWIGWRDPESQQVRVSHKFGDETGYLENIQIYADDRPEGRGPVGTALREDRIDVCNDLLTEPRMGPWREAALRGGHRSCIALPVRIGGAARGVLTAYAAEPCFFAQEEIALLEEAAIDVGFGLENLDREDRRRQAEAALYRAEEKYRGIFANAIEGIFQTTPEGTFLAANPAMARIFGYDTPEELIRERSDIAQEGYADARVREEFKRRIEADGIVNGFEYEAICRDGRRIWVSENARLVRDESGHPIHYEGSLEDITERRRANLRIIEQLEELRRWHEATLGREERILELKREVNELLARAVAPPRYLSTVPPEAASEHE